MTTVWTHFFVLQSNGTNNGKVSYKTEPLKLDMSATVPPPSTNTAPPPVTPATTSTPLSSRPRYPKEDPTLEYGAYDNPALAPSPVFENSQPETTPVARRQESSFWTGGNWTHGHCEPKESWAQYLLDQGLHGLAQGTPKSGNKGLMNSWKSRRFWNPASQGTSNLRIPVNQGIRNSSDPKKSKKKFLNTIRPWIQELAAITTDSWIRYSVLRNFPGKVILKCCTFRRIH